MRILILATSVTVLRLILRTGLVMAAVGVGLGLMATLAASQLLTSLLWGVEATDPAFRQACLLLADAFETEGHFDLAAAKLDEHIATFRPNHATADTYSRLAELWEQAGHFERALDVLEDLRRREPTFPSRRGKAAR